MALQVRSEKKTNGIYVVYPSGSLDNDTCTIFEQEVDAVLSQKPRAIIFDMIQLDYISSVGIRSILKVRKALKNGNGGASLIHCKPHVEKVLEMVNDLSTLRLFTSEDQLDRYLGQMQERILDRS
jgi:anti-sigma B factor antagonist